MQIILPGKPLAQIRMKFSSKGGFGRIYDPRAKDKARISGEIKTWKDKALHQVRFLEHPRVCFVFHTPIPASTPKKLLAIYRSGLLKDERKPDVDNYIKLYLDCLDKILFDGDQKVMLGPCVKLYHPEPKTIIFINELSATLTPGEVDQGMWLPYPEAS